MKKMYVLFIALAAIATQCADKSDNSMKEEEIKLIKTLTCHLEKRKKEEFKRLIIAHPELVNTQKIGTQKNTPLLHLLYFPIFDNEKFDTECIDFLLKNGADPDLISKNGTWNPLTFCVYQSNIYPYFSDVAKLLLEKHHADPNILVTGSNATTYSALHLAAVTSNNEMAQLLLNNGATKTLTDIYGKTAEQIARSKETEALIRNYQQPAKRDKKTQQEK